MAAMICAVVPTLNAERTLGACLGALTRAAIDGLVREVVVVDGGSADASLEIADDAGADILKAAPDRGAQLALGCTAAKSPWLLTLRQDAHLLPGWEAIVARHMETAPDRAAWFSLQSGGVLDRWRGPADGDALLIPRARYGAAGGFAAGVAERRLAGRMGRMGRLAVPFLSPAAPADPGAR